MLLAITIGTTRTSTVCHHGATGDPPARASDDVSGLRSLHVPPAKDTLEGRYFWQFAYQSLQAGMAEIIYRASARPLGQGTRGAFTEE